MSQESEVLAGVLLLSLVTVETGGLYLMKLWRDAGDATAPEAVGSMPAELRARCLLGLPELLRGLPRAELDAPSAASQEREPVGA